MSVQNKKNEIVVWLFKSIKYLLIITLFFGHSLWAKGLIYTSFFSNVAVDGYDVVSYFTGDRPQKGLKKFSFKYKKTKWLFVNQKNLDVFKVDPTKYEPQYGGYCAYAVANGQTAKGDPLLWDVHQGKLYLNYNNSIKEKWGADKEAYIKKAETHWPGVLK